MFWSKEVLQKRIPENRSLKKETDLFLSKAWVRIRILEPRYFKTETQTRNRSVLEQGAGGENGYLKTETDLFGAGQGCETDT